MISSLASPSVCLIDEDEKDFRPILDALNGLYLSCIHIRGDEVGQLPEHPFKGLRLIFTDLHLSGSVGKDAASYTANVFRRVVSEETAPIVVVIWSKYAGDQVADPEIPPEDQETEAELFKRTLLEQVPKYNGRLIFVEMSKPRPSDQPADWVEKLKVQIKETLQGQEAVDALWIWESLVREACLSVSEGMTALAQPSFQQLNLTLADGLKLSMQLLAKAQGESDLSATTAPRHLSSILGQLLLDQLEHTNGLNSLMAYGTWLSTPGSSANASQISPQMNGFLLTSNCSEDAMSFVPGTVYKLTNAREFYRIFGKKLSVLIDSCCTEKRPKQKWREWRNGVRPILVEISPACDVAQGHRSTAFLVAGVIVPANLTKYAKKGADAWKMVPDSSDFSLRWPKGGFNQQDVRLVLCSRFKATLPAKIHPTWLEPWFRLREMPTASLRNWHAGHASRVGYVSL